MSITKKRIHSSHKKQNQKKYSHRKKMKLTRKQKAGGYIKSSFDPTKSTKTQLYNTEQKLLNQYQLTEEEREAYRMKMGAAAGVGATAAALITAGAYGKLGSASLGASSAGFKHFLSSLFLGTKTGAGLGGSFFTAPLSLWIIGILSILGGPLLLKMMTTTIGKEHVSNIYLIGILNEMLRNASLEKFHSMYKSIEFLMGPDISSKDYWSGDKQKKSKEKLINGLHKQKIEPFLNIDIRKPNINNPEENSEEERIIYDNMISFHKIKTRLKYNWADTPENLRLINLRKQAYLWDIFQQKWIPESIWRLLPLKYENDNKMKNLYNEDILRKVYSHGEYRIILDSDGLWRYSIATKFPQENEDKFSPNKEDGKNEIMTSVGEISDGLLVYDTSNKVKKKNGQLYFCDVGYTHTDLKISNTESSKFQSITSKIVPIKEELLLERHLLDFINIYGFEIGLYREDEISPFTISNVCDITDADKFKTIEDIKKEFSSGVLTKKMSTFTTFTNNSSSTTNSCTFTDKEKIIIYLKRIKEHTYSSTESNSSRNYFLLIETDSSDKFEKLSIYSNNKQSETIPTEQEQQIVTITRTASYEGLSSYFQKVLIKDNKFTKTTFKNLLDKLWSKQTQLYSGAPSITIAERLDLVLFSEKIKGFTTEGPKIGLNFLRKYSIENCAIKPLLLYGTANLLGTIFKSKMKIKTMILYEILATELLQMFCTFRTLLRVFIEYVPIDSGIDKEELDKFEIKEFKLSDEPTKPKKKKMFSTSSDIIDETKKKMWNNTNNNNLIEYLRTSHDSYEPKKINEQLKKDANRLFLRRFSCRSENGTIVNIGHFDRLTIPVYHDYTEEKMFVFLFNGHEYEKFVVIESPNKFGDEGDEAKYEPVWIPVKIPSIPINTAYLKSEYGSVTNINKNNGTDKATWESYLNNNYYKDEITDISRKGCIGIKKITYFSNNDGNEYYEIETDGEHTFVEHDRIQFVWNLRSTDEDTLRKCKDGEQYCNIFQNCKGHEGTLLIMDTFFEQEQYGKKVINTNKPYHLQRTNDANKFRIFVKHAYNSLDVLDETTFNNKLLFDAEKINKDLSNSSDDTYYQKYRSPLYAIRIIGNPDIVSTDMDANAIKHFRYETPTRTPNCRKDVERLNIFSDNQQIVFNQYQNLDYSNTSTLKVTEDINHDLIGTYVYRVINSGYYHHNFSFKYMGNVVSVSGSDITLEEEIGEDLSGNSGTLVVIFSNTELHSNIYFDREFEYVSEDKNVKVFKNTNLIEPRTSEIKLQNESGGWINLNNLSWQFSNTIDYFKFLKISLCSQTERLKCNYNWGDFPKADDGTTQYDSLTVKMHEFDTLKFKDTSFRSQIFNLMERGKSIDSDSRLHLIIKTWPYAYFMNLLPFIKTKPFKHSTNTVGSVGTYTLILPELSSFDHSKREVTQNLLSQQTNYDIDEKTRITEGNGIYDVGFLVQDIDPDGIAEEVISETLRGNGDTDSNQFKIHNSNHHTLFKNGAKVTVCGPDNHRLFYDNIKRNHSYFIKDVDDSTFTLSEEENGTNVTVSDGINIEGIDFIQNNNNSGYYFHTEMDVAYGSDNNYYTDYMNKIGNTFDSYPAANEKAIGGGGESWWNKLFGKKTATEVAKDATPQSLKNLGATKGNLKHNLGKVLQSSAVASVALELPLIGWVINMNRKKYNRQIKLDKYQLENIAKVLCGGHGVKPKTLQEGFDDALEYEEESGKIKLIDQRIPIVSSKEVIILLRNFDIQSLGRVKMSFKSFKSEGDATNYVSSDSSWSGKTRWRYDIRLRNNSKENAPKLMEDFPLAFNPCLSGFGGNRNQREESIVDKGVEEGAFQKKESGGKGLFSKKHEPIENVEVGRGIGHGTMKNQDALATITSKFISFFGQGQQDDVKESVMNLITKYSSNLLMIGPGIFKEIEILSIEDAVTKLNDNGLSMNEFASPFGIIANHKVMKLMKTLKKISNDFESHTAKNKLIHPTQILDLSNDLPKKFLEIKRLYSIISSIEKSRAAAEIKQREEEEQRNKFNININIGRGGKKKQRKSRKNRNQKRKSRKN